MSTNVVVPDSIISSAARRVPTRTNSGETVAFSAGKMYFVSQSINARSSARPRYRTIGTWVCALIRPGMMIWPRASMVVAARSHRDDRVALNRDGGVLEDSPAGIHGHHRAAGDQQRHAFTRSPIEAERQPRHEGDQRHHDHTDSHATHRPRFYRARGRAP